MSFPFLFVEGFESGGTIATASSGALIDFPHYSELARQGMAPYRGGYAARIRLAGGVTSQFIREDTAFDTAAAGTIFARFYFYLGKDLVMAASDKFSLMELESVLNTTTVVAAGIQNNAGNLEFWTNLAQATATPATFVLGTTTTALGRWYCAEIKALVDDGGGDNGTITGYIDDAAMTAKTGLDQGAIVDAKFGVIGPDAGTSGTVLIDDIIADDARIYRDKERFREANVYQVQADDHPIIGPGRFSAAVTGTGTNAVLSLYDSDGVPLRKEPFAVLRNLTANEFVPGHDLFDVTHGLYATLTGTGVQAFFSIDRAYVNSDAGYINFGLKNGKVSP